MKRDVVLFQAGKSDTCWSAKFLGCMARIGLTNGRSYGELREMSANDLCDLRFSEVDVAKALDKAYTVFRGTPTSSPRVAGSKGLAWTRSHAWFSSDNNKHLEVAAPPKHVASLMRFRLGCCSELRLHDHTIQNRSNRYCTACFDEGRVGGPRAWGTKYQDDEFHMVFECTKFNELRDSQRWRSLFAGYGQDMKAFMNQENQVKVAHFIHTLLEIKKRPDAKTFVNFNPDMFESSSFSSDLSDDVLGTQDVEMEVPSIFGNEVDRDSVVRLEAEGNLHVAVDVDMLEGDGIPIMQEMAQRIIRKRRRIDDLSPRGAQPVRARFL